MAGDYEITATFMGDNSYGGSWARTHVTVAEAPRETVVPAPTQTANTPCALYTIGSVVAIIITLAIAVLLLRKKP